MKKRNIWDTLVWVAIIVFLVWIILKLTGVIQSPVLVELIPYISGAYVVGRVFQKLETTLNDVETIKTEVKEIDKRLMSLEIKNDLKKKK